MFATSFDYYRAGSVAEAGKLLAEKPGAKILAGGHSLIPILKLRLAEPTALIDIGRIPELKGVSVKDGKIRIGALTPHADVAASKDVQDNARALSDAAAQIGDPAVRNRGTVGGNLAHADPASDLPAVVTALGGAINLAGPEGERSISASDFFQGTMMTALGENEVLTSVELPVEKDGTGSAYSKFPHPASRYAVIGCAATVTMSCGKCSAASIVLGGLTGKPTHAKAVEDALIGKELSDDEIAEAAKKTADSLGDDLIGDLFASAEYRRSVAHVYVRRALLLATARAK